MAQLLNHACWGLQQLMKREAVFVSAGILFLALIYRALNTLYFCFFHPLSRFAGPSEAVRSNRWIYRVTDGGFPEEELEKLHEQYQTKALRIGPNELHISDVHLYKVIYSQSKPFPKHGAFYEAFNTPHTVFAETDPGLHKERRRLLNPFFSRAGVFKLEPIIHEMVGIMQDKISRLKNSHDINLYDAFRCLTTEVIMEFAFAKSANMLEENDTTFESWFLTAFDAVASSLWKMQELPMLRKISGFLPDSLVTLVDPQIANVFRMLKYAESCLKHYERNGNITSHPVIFDNLSTLPYQQKVTEALDILIAGADTTAATLTAGLIHILSNPEIHGRLVQALSETDPGLDATPSFRLLELEKIPYLVCDHAAILTIGANRIKVACVKESLRVGMAVPGRLPRVVPQDLPQPFVVDGQVVPPGTVVSISAYTMHTSKEIWGPDARSFNPDRWLSPEAKSFDQYLCTFSKGARMCIGQNVAFAEITIAMAYLFRTFRMSLLPDFQPPRRKDLFTMEYSKPGLPVKFMGLADEPGKNST